MFDISEKQFLLSLARRSIEHYLTKGQVLAASEADLPSSALREKQACFVTLTLNGELRGCIGHLAPIQPLYLDVLENAAAAAFQDPRFYPLTAEELKRIKIEISVLSLPALLAFFSPADLLAKLRPGVDGVLIKKGRYQAAFLPQVWEELPKPQEFLGHLCVKAGLSSECWQEKGIEVEVYQAEKIGE